MAVVHVAAQAQQTKITKLAFLSRFTDAEAISIDMASIDDTTATIEARTQSAAIRRYLAKINAASFVDVTRADTIAGINSLSVMGFITVERVTEILSTEITTEEMAL